MTVPGTAYPQTWRRSRVRIVVSAAHVLQLMFDANGSRTIGNIHWLQLTTVSTVTTPCRADGAGTAAAASSSQDQPVVDEHRHDSDGFQIDRSPDGNDLHHGEQRRGQCADVPDTGLSPLTTYFYRVEATNPAGPLTSSNTAVPP